MTEKEFIQNKYRVLLTRARFGTVIYIPAGDAADEKRQPEEFDVVWPITSAAADILLAS